MPRSRLFVLVITGLKLSACGGGAPPPTTPVPTTPVPASPEATADILPAPEVTYDLIIENGRIVDGSGNAWFYGDLAVKDGRIARITSRGMLLRASTTERVDAFRAEPTRPISEE